MKKFFLFAAAAIAALTVNANYEEIFPLRCSCYRSSDC